MKFYNSFEPGPKVPSPSGDKLEPVYAPKIDKNGHKTLVKTSEKRNVYARTQASLESTKVENIIKRHYMGDEQALNQRAGQYLDLTQAPTSLLDAQQKIINAQKLFDAEKIEVKKEFNQNMNEWLNSINDGTYTTRAEKALGITAKKEEQAKIIAEEKAALQKVTGTSEVL